MQKNGQFSGGPSLKFFFLLFLSKTFSLGLLRNFLDHAIPDPRHHPQKVPVPPGSTNSAVYIKFFIIAKSCGGFTLNIHRKLSSLVGSLSCPGRSG